ncbi:helix-turn-helix domain-containing protein [Synergistes jonesii]|uniref:helix-turn-helix domain-containing protein n=1 Tax=Synergistes jonesii TaxID=2754 RepID=UPI00248EF442|nr:cupin domain-containing protein [Synergistes jonesii]
MGSVNRDAYSKENTGKRIKSFRLSQNISISKLAGEIGVSKSLISQVERGEVYPSLHTLEKMSSALKVPLNQFFQIEENVKQPEEAQSSIVKSGRHKIILMPDTNNRYHVLTPSVSNNPFEFLLIEFPPHDNSSQRDNSVHKGEQCFYILEGTLTLNIEDKSYTVSAGDSGFIASYNRHSFFNNSGKPAKAIIVTTNSIL